jgi:hypothetical protein
MSWLVLEWHRVIIAFLGLDHLYRRILNWDEDITKTRALFGRKDAKMSLFAEGEVLLKLIPALEKIIADAKTASTDPAIVQLVTDVETLIADVKAGMPAPTGLGAPPTP